MSVFTPDGAQSQAIVLGGSSGALGLGSGSDGLAYVMRPEDEVLEIVTAGPWVEILSASPTVLASASDTLDLSFSVAFGNDLSGSCTYAATVDAHAADGGTPVSSATGTASSTAPTSLSLSGADLLAGSHRLFITCADAEGDEGSASVPYSLGTLVAPSDFAAVPGDELVTLSWSDLSDGSADHYLLYFDDATFEATTDPVECTTEGLSCSPLVVTADIEAAGDDDDDDDDDDDSADGGSAEAATVSLVVSPLTNDIPWFFAVAAVDADGNIGPRSSILSVTPSVTGGAAALAGDPGGCGCTVSHFSSGPRSLLALGVLLGASFLLVGTRRRRRRLRP